MGRSARSQRRRLSAAFTVVGLVAAMTVVPVVGAAAAPVPIMQRPAEAVSATALPTVQVDGVVWSQVIVGNTVYVGGSFTTATSAATDPVQSSTPRSNLLAYDLTTGRLITSFDVPLNGQAMYLTTSPDQSRLYVGGDFTTAGGTTHRRLVAISVATGTVIESFKPNLDARVGAIVATGTTVYAGGNLTVANGNARQRFAAFNAADGSLTSWAPTASGTIKAMVASPDGTKIIVGGQFQQVNGVNVYGLAAVSPFDGSLVPWTASGQVRAYGNTSGITTLRSFGGVIYGTGFTFGPLAISGTREFEGTFAADGNTGNIVWLEDCHGDSYDAYAAAGVVYAVSHAHECSTVGGFGERDPGEERRAIAFTEAATGTLNANTVSGYKNWAGTPSPTMINWFPDLNVGTFTGQSQAAWTVTGSGPYVVMGGEFPTVNGQPQRGLVRFATRPTAPATEAPIAKGSNLVASATSSVPGEVRLRFRSSWDRDDLSLTYSIVRNGDVNSPVHTMTANATFWDRPVLSFTDTGLTPGATYTYRIYATDADGNRVQGDLTSVTVAGGAGPAVYAQRVIADGASLQYRLGEPGGGVVFDSVGIADATPLADVAPGVAGALTGDTDTGYRFPGTQTGTISGPQTSVTTAGAFTLEAWVRTTTPNGGVILDFGNRATGNSTSLDRILYLDNTGRVQFSVLSGSLRTISSTNTYRDGNWHHVAATLGSGGMKLYVDGQPVASRTATTTASNMSGFWRIGGDRSSGLSPRPNNGFLAADIDEVAVYPTALSDAKILNHFQVGTGTVPNTPPTAAFTQTVTGADVAVNGSASADPDGTIVSYGWNWGDGTTGGSGATATHTYATDGIFTVTLTVTDNRGGTATSIGQVTVVPNQAPVAEFTSSVENQTVAVDGTSSTDPDGAVTGFSWNWGDGSPDAAGATASHTYTTAGVHTVTLTVTDNRGGTHSVSDDVTTTAAPNVPPTAAFNTSANARTLTVNGSSSTDPDGTVASYSWNWGDNSDAGTGANATHTYAADGTYSVTLTVTDDEGATNSITKDVPITSAVAADAFNRTLASGWGTADIGGAWTLTGGASKFSMNSQTGSILMSTAGSGPSAALGGVSARDVTGTLDFAVDKAATGGGVYTTVSTRRSGTSSYQFTLKYLAGGAVTIAVVRVDTGTSTTLGTVTVPGLAYAVGDTVRLQFAVTGTGTTTLSAKAWKVGGAVPAAYQITRTDSAASLQGPGSFSLQAYLSGSSSNAPVVASFDNISLAAG